MKEKVIRWWQQESILCVALVLAFVSMFFVRPDFAYITYIDFRTLAILFCLMAVMAGLKNIGFFQYIAEKLLGKVRKLWQLVFGLVLLCFFSAMLITNDVALITFVPFTFVILGLIGPQAKRQLLVPIVVLQTVAANLGSMLTPIGNPQNLYLYSKFGIPLSSFFMLMLPYALAALLIIVIWGFVLSRVHQVHFVISLDKNIDLSGTGFQLIVYAILFGVDLLTVARLVPYGIMLGATIIVLFLTDRKIFWHIDYSLLFTFVGFFIFIGNIGRVPAFHQGLQQIVCGNELLVSVILSQIISNVPAALLLSGFTDNYAALLIGVNLGGLGTLIASMASLISYKLVIRENREIRRAYLRFFTAANICILILLLVFAFFMYSF